MGIFDQSWVASHLTDDLRTLLAIVDAHDGMMTRKAFHAALHEVTLPVMPVRGDVALPASLPLPVSVPMPEDA